VGKIAGVFRFNFGVPLGCAVRIFPPPYGDNQTIRRITAQPELAAQICELPYDVMSSDEARTIAAGNPLSFLHVSKPEIDLPPGAESLRAGSLCERR